MQGSRWGAVVIDDNATDRSLLCGLLRMDGRFDVAARCADGASGIAAARERLPDIVLCDVFLGDGLDGFGVVDELAALRIPVVLVSSDATMRDFARSSAAAGFVHKGQSPAEVAEACAEAVQRQAQPPTARFSRSTHIRV